MLSILRLVAKLVFFDEIALQLRVQKKSDNRKRLSLCRDDKSVAARSLFYRVICLPRFLTLLFFII